MATMRPSQQTHFARVLILAVALLMSACDQSGLSAAPEEELGVQATTWKYLHIGDRLNLTSTGYVPIGKVWVLRDSRLAKGDLVGIYPRILAVRITGYLGRARPAGTSGLKTIYRCGGEGFGFLTGYSNCKDSPNEITRGTPIFSLYKTGGKGKAPLYRCKYKDSTSRYFLSRYSSCVRRRNQPGRLGLRQHWQLSSCREVKRRVVKGSAGEPHFPLLLSQLAAMHFRP